MEIALERMEFFAPHGVFKEEQDIGNRFEVTVRVQVPDRTTADELGNTLDYMKLYAYTKVEMQQPVRLLETVAQGILDRIKTSHPEVLQVEVEVAKLFPPVGGRCARAVVKLQA